MYFCSTRLSIPQKEHGTAFEKGEGGERKGGKQEAE